MAQSGYRVAPLTIGSPTWYPADWVFARAPNLHDTMRNEWIRNKLEPWRFNKIVTGFCYNLKPRGNEYHIRGCTQIDRGRVTRK